MPHGSTFTFHNSPFTFHHIDTIDRPPFPRSRRPSSLEQTAAAAPRMAASIDLSGKTAFIAGVADSTGYGWAIAKVMVEDV